MKSSGRRKTSVVVTVLNEEKNILNLLNALNNQSLKPTEVIIVDGGSTDKTMEIIKNFHKNSPLEIRLLVKKGTRSRGRNLGIGQAVGQAIAVTDAGCIPHKNWLKNITKPILNKKADVVGGIYKMKTDSVFTRCSAPFFGPMSHNINTKTFIPASRSIAFTKKAWKIVDGYPTRAKTAAEDLIFAYNLKNNPDLKMTIRKSASVEWAPAGNIFKFFKDIRNHTLGNIETGYVEHLRKNYKVLFRYTLFLSILPGAVFYPGLLLVMPAYLLYPSIKFVSLLRSPLDIMYYAVLQITADMAVLSALLINLRPKY